MKPSINKKISRLKTSKRVSVQAYKKEKPVATKRCADLLKFGQIGPSMESGSFDRNINFTRTTDTKGRVNLGSRFANVTFIIKQGSDATELILTASSVIPNREMWLHQNPEALTSVMLGLQQIASGEVSESPPDIDADCQEADVDIEE